MKTLFKTTALSLATMAVMGSSWAADHTMRISHQFPPRIQRQSYWSSLRKMLMRRLMAKLR